MDFNNNAKIELASKAMKSFSNRTRRDLLFLEMLPTNNKVTVKLRIRTNSNNEKKVYLS